ncbi:hypothetical protein BDA99DRAFT_252292 [Phascolomyces articulosus]|uniref:Uncharacterized protein n=1 Tax=Phascolomyces articulosus TaxID=60185 RepID=A0AAD5K2F9_9FUNG|nr:hypothetical protein BDA99DRAFT_252292 [Phascolomyces articulosus]
MTLLEKINKANDAACDLIKIISDCDYNIDVPKKRKFRELEEAVHAIDKRHRYIQCDNVISKLQDEYATNPEDLDLGRVTRYIARVNLLVFSVAMWTGEHLQLALREYYRNIIPKSISYPPDEFDDLLDVYVGAASWAAYDQVSHIYAEENLLDGESGPNVWYLLQPFFPSDAQSLGLSDTDQGVGELLTKIKEEFDWVSELNKYIFVYMVSLP